MKIVLIAVPGAGKSTTLKYVKEMLPDVTIVNYGDYMLEVARRNYGITNRDEMRKKLPVDEYRKVQEIAAEEIAKLPGDVIIDTHASIKVQGGFYPGLPDRIITKLRPDAIVLMEFNPLDILERRAKDVGLRDRENETPDDIELHQMANRYYAFAAANAGECSVYILDFRKKPQTRPFEHAEEAARFIVNLILRDREARKRL
ncbi:adenylate kinase [Vulcanisaeta thermophila]|uniref:adenylate kinase n=1 Tax=Vulcanisaeta thermophila TaxID=867917 RepID=UPI00085292DD|nr:adenylate kinase [Vulcanisaeta thermophila]